MQNVATLRKTLSPYLGKSTVLVDDHEVDDIIDGLMSGHKKFAPEYDKISEKFWKGSAKATGSGLFDFLKGNVRYKIEPDTDQTVRSPAAIIAMRSGDCKHYASFINGVLSSLQRKGYPVGECIYRYAGYNPMTGDIHHVFAVLKDGNQEIFIDPVLPTFNNRKKYFVNEDKSASMLREISGIPGDNQVGNIFDDAMKGLKNTVKKVEHVVDVNAANAGKAVKKVVSQQQTNLTNLTKGVQTNVTNATRAVQKGVDQQVHAAAVNAQNLGKGIKITAKNVKKEADKDIDIVKKAVLKINPLTIASRNAFLGLLKLNAFNMAHRLYDFMHKSAANKKEAYDKWESMGGNTNKFQTAVSQGMNAYLSRNKSNISDYNKSHGFAGIPDAPPLVERYYQVKCWEYPYHHPGLSESGGKKSVGFDPITISALMTAAAAAIAIFSAIFKKAGWTAEDQANAQTAIDAGAAVVANAAGQLPDGGTFQAGLVTMPDGNIISTLNGSVTPTSDGTNVVTLDDTGALDPDYEYQGDSDPNVVNPDPGVLDSFTDFFQDVKTFATVNKTPLLIGAGLLVAWKAGVFTSTHTVKKRR